jgi:hypothetical protein
MTKDMETTEIDAAKNRLRQAMANASPSRLVEAYPLRSAGIALALGAVLGYSRAARGSLAFLTDTALTTLGRTVLRVLDMRGRDRV